MKKFIFVLGLAFSLLTISCSKDVNVDVETAGKRVISVSLDDVTRTSLSGLSIVWSEGDQVAIVNPQTNAFEIVDVPKAAAGTKFAELETTIKGTPLFIGYPASALEPALFSLNLGTAQDYVAGSFANNTSVLLGLYTGASGVSLSTVTGFVKVSADEAFKAVVVESKAGEPVSGSFNILIKKGTTFALESLAGSPVLHLGNLPADTKEVILSIPAGEYAQGLKFKFLCSDNKYRVASTTLNGALGAGTLVTMPKVTLSALPQAQETTILTAADFNAWLAGSAATATEGDVVTLGADIDLEGAAVTAASSFAGTFDGHGYSIKNADLSAGLFETVAATGVVKNLVIDSTCSAKADAPVFGTIVKVNAGLVSGCVNNANITTEAAHAAGAIGGMVGQSNGFVKNCINNGNITVETASITGAMYYGGVVGQVTLTKVASNKVLVSSCRNNGDLKIHCSTTPKNAYIGGVVGGNTATKLADIKLVGSILSCQNTGDVSYGFDVLSSGTYTDMGGIVGYWDGHLMGSINTGNIAYTLPTDNRGVNATCPAVAGVAGVVIGDALSLTNNGNVTINGVWAAGTAGNAGAGGYHQPIWAGVIAKHGTDYSTADNNVIATDLENNGKISGTIYMKTGGGTVHILGGVLGTSNGKLSKLYNYGEIDVLIGGKSNYVGGIIAHHSGTLLTDCENQAAVTVDGSDDVLTSQVVSGVVAYELIKGTTLTNLVNTGAVTLNESNPTSSTAYQYLAGIMGNYSGNTQTLNNCVNTGTITSNTTRKVRVAGVVAAIYDSTLTAPTFDKEAQTILTEGEPGTNPLVDCHNFGNIVVNKAGNPASSNPGSIIGGIASYCSIGMEKCSNTGSITLTDCAADTTAGLMAAIINRRYSILDCSISGQLTSNVATNPLGVFAGSLYTDPAIYDLGSAEKPVLVGNVKVNGNKPTLDADGLVAGGNIYDKAQQVRVVSVQQISE